MMLKGGDPGETYEISVRANLSTGEVLEEVVSLEVEGRKVEKAGAPAKDRGLPGKFVHRGLGRGQADRQLNAYGRGSGDRRPVSAKSLGIATADVPEGVDWDAEGDDAEVELSDLAIRKRTLFRGRLSSAKDVVNGTSASDGSAITCAECDGGGMVVVSGNHRVAAMVLEGRKGKVPVKVLPRAAAKDGETTERIEAKGPRAKALLALAARAKDIGDGQLAAAVRRARSAQRAAARSPIKAQDAKAIGAALRSFLTELRRRGLGGMAPASTRAEKAFNPDQPRDEDGKFSGGGGSGAGGSSGGSGKSVDLPDDAPIGYKSAVDKEREVEAEYDRAQGDVDKRSADVKRIKDDVERLRAEVQKLTHRKGVVSDQWIADERAGTQAAKRGDKAEADELQASSQRGYDEEQKINAELKEKEPALSDAKLNFRRAERELEDAEEHLGEASSKFRQNKHIVQTAREWLANRTKAEKGEGYVLTARDKSMGEDAARQKRGGKNPPSWAADEGTWEKAKAAAKKTYDEGDEFFWAAVAHIYRSMGGEVHGMKKSKVAKRDMGLSASELMAAIQGAVIERHGSHAWVVDVFPESEHAICRVHEPGYGYGGIPGGGGDGYYIRYEYDVDGDKVTIGEAQEVELDYAPVEKAGKGGVAAMMDDSGMSVKEMAEACGCSPGHIVGVMRGYAELTEEQEKKLKAAMKKSATAQEPAAPTADFGRSSPVADIMRSRMASMRWSLDDIAHKADVSLGLAIDMLNGNVHTLAPGDLDRFALTLAVGPDALRTMIAASGKPRDGAPAATPRASQGAEDQGMGKSVRDVTVSARNEGRTPGDARPVFRILGSDVPGGPGCAGRLARSLAKADGLDGVASVAGDVIFRLSAQLRKDQASMDARVRVRVRASDAPADGEVERVVPFATGTDGLRKAAERGIVYGIVYEPHVKDSQGEAMDVPEIEKAAHKYLRKYRQVYINHSGASRDADEVVESYVAPQDLVVEGQAVRKGGWVIAMQLGEASRALVKEGKVTGFSMGGTKRISDRRPARKFSEEMALAKSDDGWKDDAFLADAQYIEDLDVREVSLVGKAANMRTFLCYKSRDEAPFASAPGLRGYAPPEDRAEAGGLTALERQALAVLESIRRA